MPQAKRQEYVIQNWRDMEAYGVNLLTGEACALSYRGLFDLTEKGLELVRATIGAVEIKAPSDYNGHEAVASLLMPYAMFEPLAVFALFNQAKAQHVAVNYKANTYTGISIHGFSFCWTRQEVEKICQEAFGRESYRIITWPEQREGVTVGASNVHQFSGRIA